MDETRTCETCKGQGTIDRPWRRETEACYACDGKGRVGAPDFRAIFEAVTRSTTDGRRAFRKSPAKGWDRRTVAGARAYYAWRLARFHGGADVTMPMLAELLSSGDPYKDELNQFASVLARHVYGTDLAAAHRWSRALGVLPADLPGLPASAYSGGPVADDFKPVEEAMERR